MALSWSWLNQICPRRRRPYLFKLKVSVVELRRRRFHELQGFAIRQRVWQGTGGHPSHHLSLAITLSHLGGASLLYSPPYGGEKIS